MKHNLRALGALAAIAVAATTFVSQARAAPVLSLSLTPATDVAVGGAVGVDIFVSGLIQAMGGYSFDLTYDASRMLFGSFSVDPDNKMGDGGLNSIVDFSVGNTGTSVGMDVLSGYFSPADEVTLATLQGTGFRLGHVNFTALNNPGFAAFGLDNFSLSDYEGTTAFTGVTASGAQLCVIGTPACINNNVPEPMSGLLVAAALGGLALSRRKVKAV